MTDGPNLLERILLRAGLGPGGINDSALSKLYPELAQRQHVWPPSGTNAGDSDSVYRYHIWVQKCIKVVADALARLPVRVHDGEDFVESGPMVDLLAHPNERQSPRQFWLDWATHLQHWGDTFIEGMPNARGTRLAEIWARPSNTVEVLPNAEQRHYYAVRGYRLRVEGTEWTLPEQLGLLTRYTNPYNPWRGLSPIAAIFSDVRIDQLTKAWAELFFRNSARPDFAIVAPEGVSESEKQAILDEFIRRHAGDNMHLPVILEQGVTDVKTFSFPPKDVEQLALRELTRIEVASIFGVPPEVAGFGKNTYENMRMADRMLHTLTVMPIGSLRDSDLTQWGRKLDLLGPDQFVQTDYSGVASLQEEMSDLLERAKKYWDMGVPYNAAADALNLEVRNVPGGDVAWLPISHVPVGTLEKRDAPGANEAADLDPVMLERIRMAALQRTRQAQDQLPQAWLQYILGQNGKAADAPVPQLPDGERGSQGTSLEVETLQTVRNVLTADAITYGGPAHRAIMAGRDRMVDRYQDSMMRKLAAEFQRQQNDVGRLYRQARSRESQAQLQPDQVAGLVDEVFRVGEYKARWREEFEEPVAGALIEAGEQALIEIGLPVVFDKGRPEVVQASQHILGEFADKVNDTTYRDLAALFEDAEVEGLSVPQVMDRLGAYWEGRKSTASRERIARTTMTSTSNSGLVTGWRQAPDVVAGRHWLAALDNRTRDEHIQAHADYSEDGRLGPVGLEQPFVVAGERLMYPGDPKGSPGNIIHCRCTQLAAVKEDD